MSASVDAAPRFDLQSHSVHSDGALSPAEVVAAAEGAGVEILALTDHDAVSGVAEAQAAAQVAGIRVISAAEITAAFGERRDLHVLGYGVDAADPDLEAALAHSRSDRERRADRMSDALRGLGFSLDEEGLAARVAAGQAIGRPHLAQAVVSRAENRDRLAELGLHDATEFLVGYLIEGTPAFSPREAPSVAEVIALIHGAGGVAVWAHPFWDVPGPAEVLTMIDEFCGWGLDGVEAFYVTHTEEQTRMLWERCARDGMITTGSSDFHGPDHPMFSRFRAFETYGLEPVLGALAG
jgi:predicted metal-dependent phosphoesterase TrpH